MSEIGIKDQFFGMEDEMTGITREQAAEAVAELFGTTARYTGGGYGWCGSASTEKNLSIPATIFSPISTATGHGAMTKINMKSTKRRKRNMSKRGDAI